MHGITVEQLHNNPQQTEPVVVVGVVVVVVDREVEVTSISHLLPSNPSLHTHE